MILNRMETDNHVAVIRRRAGSVHFSLPRPEDNIVCTAHINEEEVITDSDGLRYAEVANPIVEAIDPDNEMEIPLYDTTKVDTVENVSLEEAMAGIDSTEVKGDYQIGTFTYRDLTNMLYSLYAFYDTHRVDVPSPDETEGTETEETEEIEGTETEEKEELEDTEPESADVV